ncbi:MAG: helix-turn-helix transcriptional regulator [Bacteroidaceae bacterium]
MIIGEKIAKRRQELNLTVEQFARELNVSLKIVESWEDGMSYPTIAMLKRISIILKIPSQELCGLVNPNEKEKERKTDTKIMNKYRDICLLSTIFILLSYVLLLMVHLYEPMASQNINVVFTMEALLIIINTLLITVSLGFMVWNLTQFISYYSVKYYKKEYKIHMWKYASIYIIISIIIGISAIFLIVI